MSSAHVRASEIGLSTMSSACMGSMAEAAVWEADERSEKRSMSVRGNGRGELCNGCDVLERF